MVLPEADRAVARGPRGLRRLRTASSRRPTGSSGTSPATSAARAAPPATRRCGRSEEGLPSADVLRGRLSRVRPARGEARDRVRAARHARRHAAARSSRRASACPSRSRSRSATSTRSSRSPAPASQSPGTFVMVVGTSICDLVIDPRRGAAARDHGRRARRHPARAATATRPGRPRSATCSRGSCRRSRRPAPSTRRSSSAAAAIGPGASGLVALDWWNGNRTILADADLSGALFGLTLQTTREQIYRALLESIAFGNRRIIENFEEHGLTLNEIVACGGIAEKSPLTMQLLADTSGLRVSVPDSTQIPARGAALFGAVAAGAFDDIASAIAATRPRDRAQLRAGRGRAGDLRSGLRDLPQPVRAARAHGRRAAPRPEAHPHRKEQRRETPDRTARDHAGALRRDAPGDHRAPGRVRARGRDATRGRRRGRLHPPGAQPRGRRGDRARVRRARARRDRDRDAHLRPGDAHACARCSRRRCR